MPILSVLLGPEPHWPELNSSLARVIHLDTDAQAIQIASLPGGMTSGKASVCLRLDLPDGRVVLAETSLALFLTAACALAAKYPQEAAGMQPDGQIKRALEAAKSALRSYQYGNAAPGLAEEIADDIEGLLRAVQQEG